MSFTFFIRNNLNKLPYSIGKYVANIPFSYRPGIGYSYNKSKNKLANFEKASNELKKIYLFKRMKNITQYAYETIPFYKNFYQSNNFNPIKLKDFDDINIIPIINKDILLEWTLENRSNTEIKSMRVNTGGSSGKTLSFYTPAAKMGIEWAHIHYIWDRQMGFRQKDLKLMLVGRSDINKNIEYDFIRHSLKLDIYSSFDLISKRIMDKYSVVPIVYIHGYPSAIYEFALFLKNNQKILYVIKKNLKGVILVSEFPYDYLRDEIENVFNVKSFSFYGHTEGCAMAYERERNQYYPLHTYGYVESTIFGEDKHLIGTNFYNFASPMIRYDTEDLVDNLTYDKSLLKSFSIKKGRKGEFVVDKNYKYISLTGLIFGRHHELFNFCSHIQVRQKSVGVIEILYVLKGSFNVNPSDLFDSSKLEMDLLFKRLQSPIRTISGKVNLLV